VFATNGVDSSAIITRTYRPTIDVLRQSHDQVSINSTYSSYDRFPYGSNTSELPALYGGIGPDDSIVNKPDGVALFDGYDGTGTGTQSGGTDLSLDNYGILYSEANAIGERGRGIGTLPTTVTFTPPPAQQILSNMNDRYFDPRAMVIYQDSRQEPFDPELLQINRQYFSLEDANIAKIKDGALLNTTAIEGLTTTGSFVKAQFNPRENTTTYYYFDSQTLRWIISKEQAPTLNPRRGLFNILFSSRERGSRYVYKWVPFKGSRII
jgi:hypothetical protein